MDAAEPSTDYRALMRKVERLVAEIEGLKDTDRTIHTVTERIIAQFRDELGIYGGRLYKRDGDDYVLRDHFGAAKPVKRGLRVSRHYPPIEACLRRNAVLMTRDEEGVDPEFEAGLGVKEFACTVVGNEDYILAFNVSPGADREDVVFSLQILRHVINQKIRQRRMEGVFSEARRIQASILPVEMPTFPPYDIAGRSVSVDSVGGDFFDFIPINEKILGLAVADVSGHGLPAALQVRDIYMGLRMGMARDFKIVRTVERLNEIIHQSTLTSRFVALCYGELEDNGNFIYVNAGHVAPVHLRADGSHELLQEGGPVLGPLPSVAYDRGFVHVRPGDLLVFFTDGIVETLQAGGTVKDELGVDRLLGVVRAHRERPAAEIVAAVFADTEAFGGDAPANDDRTVVVVKRPA